MGGASSNQLKALIEKRLMSLEEEGMLPADSIWTQTKGIIPWPFAPECPIQGCIGVQEPSGIWGNSL